MILILLSRIGQNCWLVIVWQVLSLSVARYQEDHLDPNWTKRRHGHWVQNSWSDFWLTGCRVWLIFHHLQLQLWLTPQLWLDSPIWQHLWNGLILQLTLLLVWEYSLEYSGILVCWVVPCCWPWSSLTLWFGIHLIQLKFEYFAGNMLSIVAVSFIGRDIAYSMYVYSSLAALALKHVLLTTIASAFCFSTMFQLNVNGRDKIQDLPIVSKVWMIKLRVCHLFFFLKLQVCMQIQLKWSPGDDYSYMHEVLTCENLLIDWFEAQVTKY